MHHAEDIRCGDLRDVHVVGCDSTQEIIAANLKDVSQHEFGWGYVEIMDVLKLAEADDWKGLIVLVERVSYNEGGST